MKMRNVDKDTKREERETDIDLKVAPAENINY